MQNGSPGVGCLDYGKRRDDVWQELLEDRGACGRALEDRVEYRQSGWSQEKKESLLLS